MLQRHHREKESIGGEKIFANSLSDRGLICRMIKKKRTLTTQQLKKTNNLNVLKTVKGFEQKFLLRVYTNS